MSSRRRCYGTASTFLFGTQCGFFVLFLFAAALMIIIGAALLSAALAATELLDQGDGDGDGDGEGDRGA